MILSKKSIENQIKYGNILIDPYHPDQLGANGYDLHLGNTLLRIKDGVLDTKKDISSMFEQVNLINGFGEGQWLLLPGTLYLGVTAEYTESRAHVPVMEGKSSLGRMGISVHHCAGFGDVGFCGHWTLEITVVNPTILYPGMPIGQVVWHTVEGAIEGDYKETGSYNNQRGANPKPGIPNLWRKLNQFIKI